LSNYFEGCNTTTELAIRRSDIIAQVNKEFGEAKARLLNSSSGIRQIRLLQLDAIGSKETPLYTAFRTTVGEARFNEIILGDPIKL